MCCHISAVCSTAAWLRPAINIKGTTDGETVTTSDMTENRSRPQATSGDHSRSVDP